MKYLIAFSVAFIFLQEVHAQEKTQFGRAIDDKNAVPAEQLKKNMGEKTSAHLKVAGKVDNVCQVKGCWMTIRLDNGDLMRVKFKDYAFFVPKDISGRTVVFEGEAHVKTTPVAELQHYAYDAGKSKEEIAKITEPKKELTFLADGVLLK